LILPESSVLGIAMSFSLTTDKECTLVLLIIETFT